MGKISLLMLIAVFTIFLCFNFSLHEKLAVAFAPANNPSTNNTITNSPPGQYSLGSFSPYVNDTFGIKIEYPASWKVFDTPGSIVQFLPSENAPSPVVDVVVEKLDPVPSLTEYLNESVATEKDLSGAKILESNTSATLAGHPAYIMISGYTPGTEENAASFKKIETGTIVGNLGYAITYDVEAQDYATYLPYVQKMIDSFQILSTPTLSSTPPDVPGANTTTIIQ